MKNTLLYRMLIVNIVVVLWVAGTNFYSNWLMNIFHQDLSQMSYLIASLFVLLLAIVVQQTITLNRESNSVSPSDVFILSDSGPELRYERLNPIVQGAGGLFVLGLVGTLIGLGLSVDKVSVENLGTAGGIKEIAAQLVGGIRTEIGVTVLGSLTGLWIEMNYVFLRYRAAWLNSIKRVL